MGTPVNLHRYFSRKEMLKDREIEYPLTPKLEENLVKLLLALNIIRETWGKPMIVTSAYRPGRYNTAAGGAKNSAHLTCEAVDISDVNGDLKEFLVKNVELLEKAGLWMEHPDRTPSWCHLQTRRVRNRIFMP